MYNERQKVNFIKGYTGSLNTANVATTIFNALEKYEEQWQADFCTRSKEEINQLSMKLQAFEQNRNV